MATLLELSDYVKTPAYEILSRKIQTAIAVKAVAIGNLASPTASQVRFATSALENPQRVATSIIHYVLAANAGYTIAQINAAGDETIQAQVNNAVDKLLSL